MREAPVTSVELDCAETGDDGAPSWPLRLEAAGVICLSFLNVAMRVPWWGGPYSQDEAIYVAVGREIFHRQLPLVTAWDIRQPFTYLLYAFSQLLPLQADLQLDVFATLFAVITGLAIYWLLRQTTSAPFALGGQLAWALVSADPSVQGQTANTEIPINALLALSFAALVAFFRTREKKWLATAGLLVGLAGTIKEIAVVVALAQGMALAVRLAPDRIRKIAAAVGLYAAAAALPWLLVVLLYGVTGHLDLIADTFAFNARYPALSAKDLAAGPILLAHRGFALYGSWPWWVLGTLFLGIANRRRRGDLETALYIVSAVVMIILPGRFFAHYYALALPALVVGGVRFAHHVSITSGGHRSRFVLAAPILLVALYQVLFATGHVPLVVRALQPIDSTTAATRTVGEQLGRHFDPARDKVFVYGARPQIFLYSGLRPEGWLVNFAFQGDFLRGDDALAARFRDRILASLASDPPAVIVVQAEFGFGRDTAMRAPLRQIVAADYVPWSCADAPLLVRADIGAIYVRSDRPMVPCR